MKAADVMTRDVITVGPDDLVQAVADVLLKHRISAVPVVDAKGDMVGIVSEGDLIHRAEAGTESLRPWWLRALSGREILAADYVKAHARKVSDVMTRNVIAATPDTPLRDIAALLDRHRIKRVPIVDKGKLVGIVSRANLVQAFASIYAVSPGAERVDDATLRKRIMDQLKSERWVNLSSLNVVVHDGEVELWGAVESEAEHRALRIAAENTPGVRAVQDYVTVGRIPGGV